MEPSPFKECFVSRGIVPFSGVGTAFYRRFILSWWDISQEFKACWRVTIKPVSCQLPFVENPVLYDRLSQARVIERRPFLPEIVAGAYQRGLSHLSQNSDTLVAAIG